MSYDIGRVEELCEQHYAVPQDWPPAAAANWKSLI